MCLGKGGRSQFRDLLFWQDEPRFCAFDLLWLNGKDLLLLPLIERKRRLRERVPQGDPYLLYNDHAERASQPIHEKTLDHRGTPVARRAALKKSGYDQWQRKIKLSGGEVRINAELEKTH